MSEDKTAYIKQLPYYGRLTEEEIKTVETFSSVIEYPKGSIIFGCDTECLGQVLLISGEMRAYIISEEGREVTLYRLYPKDTCVLTASCVIRQITFETQMTAQEDTKLLVINSGAFAKLTESNIYVKCFMYELISERFSSVMWTVQQILFMGFDRRLASFLISEYERTQSREIHMTHERIAQHVSSAREVVARMLKRFASDGLLEFKRNSITLKNIEALKIMI